MNKIIIIIPTYNEKKNIRFIVNKIKKKVKNYDLLFIDDNSPDGTKDLIKLIKKKTRTLN